MAPVNNKNKIIDTKDEGIVVKETMIRISDEKLKNLLSRAYEEAQKDMSRFHFYNLYSVFLSMAGTLFLTLLTSDFHELGSVPEETVTVCVWGVCIGLAVLGSILACCKISQKTNNNTDDRDNAVKKVFNQHISNN